MSSRGRKISFRLDGRKVGARQGEFLLEVAEREGVHIPALCSFRGIRPYGACRMCVVKVRKDGREKVVTSCNYPVDEGIEVITDEAKIRRLRRSTAALLLAEAPASEEIRKLAAEVGVEEGRLRVRDAANRCIRCGLCVRVCEEIVGACAVTFAGRGDGRKVTLPFDEYDLDACTGCGACGFVCPTGCIDMEERKIAMLRQERREGAGQCRYSLMGLLPGAVCDNDYDCGSCTLDRRMFELSQGLHPAFLMR